MVFEVTAGPIQLGFICMNRAKRPAHRRADFLTVEAKIGNGCLAKERKQVLCGASKLCKGGSPAQLLRS